MRFMIIIDIVWPRDHWPTNAPRSEAGRWSLVIWSLLRVFCSIFFFPVLFGWLDAYVAIVFSRVWLFVLIVLCVYVMVRE